MSGRAATAAVGFLCGDDDHEDQAEEERGEEDEQHDAMHE